MCVLQENDSGTLDTVGAVVVDQEGNVAAAVSSGGLALKHPGRVGQVIYTFSVGNDYSAVVTANWCPLFLAIKL